MVLSRAFLSNSNIVIFDDNFSALDNKTEERVLNNIKELTKNKTCIIVSNRISDIKHCDEIVVLEQGKIVESEDMARVADVPMGGYGIFPKADLSEVYIKMWNGNGTTSLLTFQPVIKQEPVKEEGEITSLLLERIKGLEEKIDKLVGAPMLEAPQQNNAAAAISKRKEF